MRLDILRKPAATMASFIATIFFSASISATFIPLMTQKPPGLVQPTPTYGWKNLIFWLVCLPPAERLLMHFAIIQDRINPPEMTRIILRYHVNFHPMVLWQIALVTKYLQHWYRRSYLTMSISMRSQIWKFINKLSKPVGKMA